MSRKVKTPKHVADNFVIRIWFIVIPLTILIVAFALFMSTSNTIYSDNGVTIERDGNTLGVYNLTSKELTVIVKNSEYQNTVTIPKVASKVSLELYDGKNTVRISTEDFSDKITLDYE